MIESFHMKEHKTHLGRLFELRGMSWGIMDHLPEVGAIAFTERVPVAAGFLRRMEGRLAVLDSYISNPESDSRDRDIAFDQITSYLIEFARQKNIYRLFAFSLESSLMDRACRHGFKPVPYGFTALDLNER